MGQHEKTVGGSGTGLGADFASWLQQGLNSGHYGPGFAAGYGAPAATMNGMSGILNDLFSGGGGKLGGALGQMLQTQQTNDIGALRSRFGVGGGTAFGTPAAYAESMYRAQAAPQAASQIGQLQLSALLPLLGITSGMAGRDIPQAENVFQPSPWMQAASIGAPLLGGILGGPAGAGIGSWLGGMFGGGGGGGGSMGGMGDINWGSGMLSSINPFGGGFIDPKLAGGGNMPWATPRPGAFKFY
jgi:hypothetical protein